MALQQKPSKSKKRTKRSEQRTERGKASVRSTASKRIRRIRARAGDGSSAVPKLVSEAVTERMTPIAMKDPTLIAQRVAYRENIDRIDLDTVRTKRGTLSTIAREGGLDVALNILARLRAKGD